MHFRQIGSLVRWIARPLTLNLQLSTIVVALLLLAPAARATPFFARQYNLPCATCHNGFPRLNAFGLAFKANNFRIPGSEKEAPLAWQRTVPLATQVQPTYMRFHPGKGKAEFTDTQLLAGGLLTQRTAFFLHDTLWFDDKAQTFPTWEFWAQQVLDERSKIMLKAGQFELPYSASPVINRTTVSTPLVFFSAGLTPNDVRLGAAVSGFQLSGGDPGRVAWQAFYGAPGANQGGVRVGDRQFFGRFRDTFLRVAVGKPDRRIGAFGYFGSPPLTATTSDHATRLGLDGIWTHGATQVQAMAAYGENANPLGNGRRGTLRTGFIEADHMILPWLGVTGRLDVLTTSTSSGRGYQDAKTLSLRVYPLKHLKLVGDVQWLDHGRSAEMVMAAITF